MNNLLGSRLFGNIISLIVLQGSNYLFPLLTFPYLIRTLGIDNYGVLVFCVSMMQFLNVFIDYGFNISGTKDISIHKQNQEKINDIYNVIMTIKFMLVLLVGIIYIFVIEMVPFFRENRTAFLLGLLIITGNALFPIWLYQGLEKMKYITYFNIGVKAFVTVLVFLFIKNMEDFTLAVLFQTLYFFLPAIISMLFVKIKLKINYKAVLDIHRIKEEFIRGKHIFMTTLWASFYGQGPLLILGFISGSHAAGNYGIGEKVQGAFYGLSQPFTQALYPYICDLYERKKDQFYIFKQKLLGLGMIFSILIGIALLIFSAPIGAIISGTNDPKTTSLIAFFSVIVFFSIINTLLVRILHAVNLSHLLNKSFSIAAVVFVCCSFPLTILFQEFGMATTVIIAEGTVFVFNIRNVLHVRPEGTLQPTTQKKMVSGS